jgi:hypothetical protein
LNTSGYGRVVSSVLLANALKRLRQTHGQHQREVAGALEWPVSRLIRIEGCRVPARKADLQALLQHYAVTDERQLGELAALAREARLPGWWDQFRIPDAAFARYVGYESGAASIRMAQGLLVPGILQTEPYARRMTGTYAAPEDIEPVVQLRLERQEEILARAPEQYHIIDEAALRRQVGDVMPGQLRHLAELASKPEITIRVIPFGAGPHFGMRGPFVLLGFDLPLGNVLFLESARGNGILISEEEVSPGHGATGASAGAEEIARCEDGFEELKQAALDEAESINLIEQIASESALTSIFRAGDVLA